MCYHPIVSYCPVDAGLCLVDSSDSALEISSLTFTLSGLQYFSSVLTVGFELDRALRIVSRLTPSSTTTSRADNLLSINNMLYAPDMSKIINSNLFAVK
jgi:hypothetical protein